MCGRLQQPEDAQTLAERFDALWSEPEEAARWRPNLNLCPTDPAPILLPAAGRLPFRLAHFGLVAPWMKHRRESARLINARSETADTRPAFRDAWRHRRCAIPAGGWYEWGTPPGADARGAWLHHHGEGAQVLLAGLWSPPQPALGVELPSFSILTIEAKGVAADVHHRMPVLLDAGTRGPWLDGVLHAAEAHSLAIARIPLVRRALDPRLAAEGETRAARGAPQLALPLDPHPQEGGPHGQND